MEEPLWLLKVRRCDRNDCCERGATETPRLPGRIELRLGARTACDDARLWCIVVVFDLRLLMMVCFVAAHMRALSWCCMALQEWAKRSGGKVKAKSPKQVGIREADEATSEKRMQ